MSFLSFLSNPINITLSSFLIFLAILIISIWYLFNKKQKQVENQANAQQPNPSCYLDADDEQISNERLQRSLSQASTLSSGASSRSRLSKSKSPLSLTSLATKTASNIVTRAATAVLPDLEYVPHISRSGRKLKRRERALILAKKMIKRNMPIETWKKTPLASNMLEPNTSDNKNNFPDELSALYKTVQIFGHFDKPVFLSLCKQMEPIDLREGEYLFRRGELDKNIYVVQSGQVNVYVKETSNYSRKSRENSTSIDPSLNDNKTSSTINNNYTHKNNKNLDNFGCEWLVAEVKNGESIHSLLSVLDVMTNHMAPFKTVSARAVTQSKVLKLPVEAMKKEFDTNPDALIRLVQVISMRLQRVTMFTLHNYLGLTPQLINSKLESFDISNFEIAKLTNLEGNINESIRRNDSDILLDSIPENNEQGLTSSLSNTTRRTSQKLQKTRFSEIDTVVKTKQNDKNVYHKHSNLNTGYQDELSLAYNRAFSRESSEGKYKYNPGKGRSKVTNHRYNGSLEIRECMSEEILKMAQNDITNKVFGIKDCNLLNGRITLLKVPENCLLTKEGDYNAAMYFVVTGCLTVYQCDENNEDLRIFNVLPGMVTGQLAVLTGEPSMFSLKAKIDTLVVRILKSDLFSVLRGNTSEASGIILHIAHSITRRMSPFIRQIDFALDWVTVESGKVLYRQKDKAEACFIVLNGRLRSVVSTNDNGTTKKYIDAEYGRGDIIGLSENIRGTNRPNTVHAVRDTELAKIPDGLLTMIRKRYPSVTTRIAGFIGSIQPKERISISDDFSYGDLTNLLSNLSTIAIIPSSYEVPLDDFTKQLENAVVNICSAVRLTSDKIRKKLGNAAFDQYEWQLISYLGSVEEVNRLVLYQTDDVMNAWTRRCLRQADAILIVARSDCDPNLGKLERELEHLGGVGRSLKMLVLLHPEKTIKPTRTVTWLNKRSWLTTHFHVKAPEYFFKRNKPRNRNKSSRKPTLSSIESFGTFNLRNKSQDSDNSANSNQGGKFTKVENDGSKFSDFGRLARFLTGTSVAVVFGGGGARGCAQVGILETLIEQGIPVDMIGGTSIGSFNGALWAKSRNVEQVVEDSQKLSSALASIWMKLFDLTYPKTSLFSGKIFGAALARVLEEDCLIEDLWIPYFATSTDLVTSKIRIHKNGSLWRYVRASMSLSGYFPPICDPQDGHMLMDGGYINNLPADIAKSIFGACKVIAVDVGSVDNFDKFENFGDSLSGWNTMINKLNPFVKTKQVPTLSDLQQRLSYISSHKHLEKIQRAEYVYYVRPPVNRFKTAAFDKFSDLYFVGKFHAQAIFTPKWVDDFMSEVNCHVDNINESTKQKVLRVESNDIKDLVDVIYSRKNKKFASMQDFSNDDYSQSDAGGLTDNYGYTDGGENTDCESQCNTNLPSGNDGIELYRQRYSQTGEFDKLDEQSITVQCMKDRQSLKYNKTMTEKDINTIMKKLDVFSEGQSKDVLDNLEEALTDMTDSCISNTNSAGKDKDDEPILDGNNNVLGTSKFKIDEIDEKDASVEFKIANSETDNENNENRNMQLTNNQISDETNPSNIDLPKTYLSYSDTESDGSGIYG